MTSVTFGPFRIQFKVPLPPTLLDRLWGAWKLRRRFPLRVLLSFVSSRGATGLQLVSGDGVGTFYCHRGDWKKRRRP